jgi:hypothetical protein
VVVTNLRAATGGRPSIAGCLNLMWTDLGFRHHGSPWIPSAPEGQLYGYEACYTTLYTAIILMVKTRLKCRHREMS